jgi:hypothetical protein
MVVDMSPPPMPERILRSRTVPATDVLEGRADLRSYPFRYLAVVANRGVGAEQVTYVLTAVEVLSQSGWKLVTISEFAASRVVYAFVRRG